MRPTLPTLTRRAVRQPTVAAGGPPVPTRWGCANVAHRGASASAPENTLAAVRRAIAHDADLVEFDVQRTRDGALVLMHDPTLERTTDVRRVFPGRGPWRVADFSYDELQRLDAGSWRSPEQSGERIPLLSDALDVLGLSEVGALVELKLPGLYPGIVDELAAALRAGLRRPDRTSTAGRLVVQSFDVAAMRALREAAPHLSIGVLGSQPTAWLPELARWADQVNPHHVWVDRSYVEQVHDAGLECFVWTVNRIAPMRRALSFGVDGVITDRPDLLHQVRLGGAPLR